MIAGVMSFGFHVPPWVLGVGLALLWLAGLAVGPRGKVECRKCRELRGVPGEINPAAYAHYMAEHYPRRSPGRPTRTSSPRRGGRV